MRAEQAMALKGESSAVSNEARGLFDGHGLDALMKRPAGGGWSAAENVQHLILTADAMLPLAEEAIAQLEKEQRRSTRSPSLGFLGWMLVKSLEPPSRMKTKTLASFEPVAVGDPATLLQRFVDSNHAFDRLVDRATGLDTGSVKIASPFNARVRYNAYAALRIVMVHARRHLFQARRALAA